jgi:hypothetical protein
MLAITSFAFMFEDVPEPVALSARVAAAFLFERGVDVSAPGLNRRCESERHSGDHRHAERERQHPRIDANSLHCRQARAAPLSERPDTPEGHQ